jgi:ribosomal protein L1
MQQNIQNAIQEALDNAPERKFVESVEMAIKLVRLE